jgi:hypothetical protein
MPFKRSRRENTAGYAWTAEYGMLNIINVLSIYIYFTSTYGAVGLKSKMIPRTPNMAPNSNSNSK